MHMVIHLYKFVGVSPNDCTSVTSRKVIRYISLAWLTWRSLFSFLIKYKLRCDIRPSLSYDKAFCVRRKSQNVAKLMVHAIITQETNAFDVASIIRVKKFTGSW